MRAHPDGSIEVSAGGSKAGLAKVSSGEVTLGSSDVFASPDATELRDHRIAVVGLAAMANQGPFDEGVTSLTHDAARGIFTGKLTDWAEVGGRHQPILVINRAKESGTRAAFGALVLGGEEFVSGFAEQESSSKVQAMLLQTPGSISYLALSYRHEGFQNEALPRLGFIPIRRMKVAREHD